MFEFSQSFAGKTVIVTGHTGFKGSWLCLWLEMLGAKVIGVSDRVPTQPAHYEAAGLGELIDDRRCDLRDLHGFRDIVSQTRPDYVFHLAAQPIVRRSYDDPIETFSTNVMGTAHVLEALRVLDSPCSAVLVTSDKCYDNVEWVWGYRETDRLGGKDPYSASKGAAELIIRGYVASFYQDVGSPVRVAVGRAGNVIGGGDWAGDRLVPDCVRAWSRGDTVAIRQPHSTRPWQHVLEPLSGYMCLAASLQQDPGLHGEAFNFGPRAEVNHSVGEVIEAMGQYWRDVQWQDVSATREHPHEAGLLKLNCDKALHHLRWQPVLDFDETVRMTAQWYGAFYGSEDTDICGMTRDQIRSYVDKARTRQGAWRDDADDD